MTVTSFETTGVSYKCGYPLVSFNHVALSRLLIMV